MRNVMDKTNRRGQKFHRAKFTLRTKNRPNCRWELAGTIRRPL